MMRGDSQSLRKRLELAYREYRALLIFANRLTGNEQKRLEASLESIRKLSRTRVKSHFAAIRDELASLRRELGAKADLAVYEKILKFPGEAAATTILYVPKDFIEKRLFRRYDRAFRLFTSLPPHAKIAIDTKGIARPEKPEVEWWLLEAKLFEDMALLWNATMDAQAEKESNLGSRKATKWLQALIRTTTRAAFHLLEAYVNGMALDVLITSEVGDLSQDEIAKLREWDDTRKRPRFLTLREKLLQYPKIALGAEHPPLQESNCKEMALLLEKEESLRHTLVHPKPEVEVQDPEHARERVFMVLTAVEVGKIIDSVIGLIRKLDSVLGGKFGRAEAWLRERDTGGRFPEEAFR